MASLARIFVQVAGDGSRGSAAMTAQTARLRRHSGLDPEPRSEVMAMVTATARDHERTRLHLLDAASSAA